MPPKKDNKNDVPEPVVELDPAVVAAQLEDRKLFERNEIIARQRVEAMESIGWKCVLNEKEKRLDPAGWAEKTAVKGPTFVYVKTLTGNRAIPQLNFRVPVSNKMTLRELKEAIKAEAVYRSPNPNAVAWFEPNRQTLYLFNKEINCDDEYNVTVKDANVTHGCTIQLALHDLPLRELAPASIHPPVTASG